MGRFRGVMESQGGLPGGERLIWGLKYMGRIKRCWEKRSRQRPQRGWDVGMYRKHLSEDSLAGLVEKTSVGPCSAKYCRFPPGWPVPPCDYV